MVHIFKAKSKILIGLALAVFFAGYFLFFYQKGGDGPHTGCTQEAKLCPDGSYVGRTGPNCEFAKCPGEIDTSSWKTYRNEKYGYAVRFPGNWFSFVALFMERYADVTSQDERVTFGPVNPMADPQYVNQDNQEITIERENGSYYADSKTVDDFWNKLGKYDNGRLVNKFRERRVIGGESFIIYDQYNWEFKAQKYFWSPRAAFMHNGNIFSVRPKYNFGPDIFDGMLSTFEFVN